MLCKNCALGPESQLPFCARCGQQIHLFSDPVTDEEIEAVFSNMLESKTPQPAGKDKRSKRQQQTEQAAAECTHDANELFAEIKNELQGVFKEDGLNAVSRNRLSKILRLMHPLILEFRKLEALVQIADAEGRLQSDLTRELHRTTGQPATRSNERDGPHRVV
jgi:hypothetical protein